MAKITEKIKSAIMIVVAVTLIIFGLQGIAGGNAATTIMGILVVLFGFVLIYQSKPREDK